MNEELTKLITQRFALLNIDDVQVEYEDDDDDDVVYWIAPSDEEEYEDSETYIEVVPIDFDYDIASQVNFQLYMSMRYGWNDWNARFTEVY